MTDEELEAAGLLDPSSDSPRRADLLRRCLELGLTVEEIREAGDDLVPRAIEEIFRGGREQLTLAEAGRRAGLDDDTLAAIARATGFIGPNRDRPVWDDEDVAIMASLAAGWDFLGEDAMMQVLRVSTAAVARLGDAVMSTFFTSAGAQAMAEDESGLDLLEANAAGLALLEEFGSWLVRSLIRHLRVEFRDASDAEMAAALTDGVDTPVMAIGFADLVGSASHAERRTLVELNDALERFEVTAVEVVGAHGGRIVKFIGDEVMFRADDANVAAAIALDLVEAVRSHPELPPLRSGVTYGMVLSREGDYFGPTVNLAARILKLAPMNGVVVSQAAADALDPEAGFEVESHGAIEMSGLADPVELAALRRSPAVRPDR